MQEKHVATLKDAQEAVKFFAERNGWKDEPNMDKFDHLHEELISMSQHLRYKKSEDCKRIADEKKELFVDGVGDTLFGLCRLANQLGVDMEEAFNLVKTRIFQKYKEKKAEHNIVNSDGKIT